VFVSECTERYRVPRCSRLLNSTFYFYGCFNTPNTPL